MKRRLILSLIPIAILIGKVTFLLAHGFTLLFGRKMPP